MPIELKSKLLPSDEKTAELEIFLSTYYGSSSQTEKNKIVHGGELVVEYYGKNNKQHSTSEIKSIYSINTKNSALLNQIEQKSQEALSTSHGVEVARAVLFSSYEVNGSYRFNNVFQIIPAPENAPKPEFALADHPFILEYTYSKSTHNLINNHRKQIQLEELSLILNIFIKNGVNSLNNNVHHGWVIVPNKSENTSWDTRYLQNGYILPDEDTTKKDKYGFTIINSELIIKKDEPNDYFTEKGITIGESFSLPNSINMLIEKFYSLCKNNRECFLRASYWKRVGSNSYYISQSNAYIALVNAIESLIPHEKAEWCCISCKREIKKGLTQLFHEFVESNMPGSNSSYSKELYAIRSKYTHGKHLMPNDMHATGFRFNPTNNYNSSNYRNLALVVQISMINWLMRK